MSSSNEVQNGVRDDHHKISPTSKLTAYARTFSDIPYSWYFVQKTKAREAAATLLKGYDRLDGCMWFFAPLCESRYKSIDSYIAKEGRKNILELASGLSPRGLMMSKDPSVIYVDTDLDGVVEEKKALIEGIANLKERPNFHIRAANALSRSDMEAAADLFRGEPFAIVHEGLMQYMYREEKETFRENARYLADRNDIVWLTTDILTKERLEKARASNPEIFELLSIIYNETGRDFMENAFDDDNDALRFYSDGRFDAENPPAMDGSYEVTSLKSESVVPEEKMKVIIPVMQRQRMYVARPRR